MEGLVRIWARQISVIGVCAVFLVGLVMRVNPLAVLFRAAVVGGVLYFAVLIVGGLVAQAALRLAVEENEARREAERAELERESGGEPSASAAPTASEEEPEEAEEEEEEEETQPDEAAA